jgi:hypothetical protein
VRTAADAVNRCVIGVFKKWDFFSCCIVPLTFTYTPVIVLPSGRQYDVIRWLARQLMYCLALRSLLLLNDSVWKANLSIFLVG